MTGTRAAHRRGPTTVLRALSAVSLLLAGAVGAATGWGAVPLEVLALAVVGVAAGELVVLSIAVGRQRWPASVTEGAVAACLVAADGAWSVLAVGLGVVVAQRVRRAPRAHRRLDLARSLLAMALAAALSTALGGGIAAAAAGTAVYWLVSCTLLAAAVSTTSSRPLRSLLAARAPLSGLHASASASIGLLAAFLSAEAPLGLLALAVPAAVLWSTYDRAGRGGEARLFAELARGPGRTADASASLLVTAAARLLGGADVDLLVLTCDGPVEFAGDETGVPVRRALGSAALDQPWVLRALTGGGVRLGRVDGRPYVTTVLGAPDRPLAVLRARRQVGAPDFDRRELRLADVLAVQADAWLGEPLRGTAAVDQRAVGTTTALAGVRASAERLAGLAAGSGPLDRAVDAAVRELHALERAVAALLGAHAREATSVSVPAPRTPDSGAPATADREDVAPSPPSAAAASGADADWTTTGVLR